MRRGVERPTPRRLTPDLLRELVAPRPGPLVSVYLPIQGAFPEARQNAVLLRQAVEALESRLAELAVAPDLISRYGQRLAAVETDVRELDHPLAALAIFLDAAELRVHPLVTARPYAISVGESFRVRPLLRELQRDRAFWLLALSANRVALFRGDARGLRSVDAGKLPGSLVEALGPELVGRQVEVRGGARGAGATYHGAGSPGEERGVDMERFHRAVADALAARLAGARDPVVLAADASQQSGLRAVARGVSFLSKGVIGSPDRASDADLHRQAWPLVEEDLCQRERQASQQFARARNLGKGLDLRDDVVAAAVAGRVHRLWLDGNRREPGRIDLEAGRVVEAAGDEDVLDELAAVVVLRAGEVFVLDAADMPATTGVAAELR